jgi:hypothetical protein
MSIVKGHENRSIKAAKANKRYFQATKQGKRRSAHKFNNNKNPSDQKRTTKWNVWWKGKES